MSFHRDQVFPNVVDDPDPDPDFEVAKKQSPHKPCCTHGKVDKIVLINFGTCEEMNISLI